MRDEFSSDDTEPWEKEVGVGNLNLSTQKGSHWFCYLISRPKNLCYYYNSYGNLAPPRDFLYYARDYSVCTYNKQRDQYHFGEEPSPICGHLCLRQLIKYADSL